MGLPSLALTEAAYLIDCPRRVSHGLVGSAERGCFLVFGWVGLARVGVDLYGLDCT